jgi:hypothetical protein
MQLIIFSFLISKTYILGVQLTETVIVQVYCTGDSIVDFVTSSPIGMTHSAISNPSPGKYFASFLSVRINNIFSVCNRI